MPFLRLERRQIQRFRDVSVYECDNCGMTYERRGGYQDTQASKHGLTFCSSKCYGECERKGSKLGTLVREEHAAKHGVEHPWQRPDVIEKRADTNVQRYGGPSPMNSPIVVGKMRETASNRTQDERDQTRAKTLATLEATYGPGVTNPMHVEDVRTRVKETWASYDQAHLDELNAKRITTNREKLGVDWPMQSEDVREKSRQSIEATYGPGITSPMQVKEVRDRVEATCLERFGVRNPQQNPEIRSKTSRSRREASIISYWKTGENRVFSASYEVAFARWTNQNQIEYDWQVPFVMPDGHTYFIDAHILSGEFMGTWVEIKGYYDERSRKKCEWFSTHHDNFQLWDEARLRELGVLKSPRARGSSM